MFASRLSGAVLLSIASLAPAAPRPAAQTIYLSSFNFWPKPIRLTAGKPVTLTFVNRSGSGHDFTAKAFFGNASITAGSAPDGEIELDPHETKSITLIPRVGTYKVHCSHFLHKQLGMVDEILVS